MQNEPVIKGFALVTIIKDPDPLGGFPAGNRINCLPEMIRFCSFTPDTIIQHNQNIYRISEHLGRQKVVWVAEAEA